MVTGLECLADSHFPRNCVSADVRVGKSSAADQPSITDKVLSRFQTKSGTWIQLVLTKLPRMVTAASAITSCSLVDILVMSSHTAMHHHFNFRRFRSTGMLI